MKVQKGKSSDIQKSQDVQRRPSTFRYVKGGRYHIDSAIPYYDQMMKIQ